MPTRLAELAELVQGSLLGGGDSLIDRAAVLADAGPGAITFIDHVDKLPRLAKCTAAAVVVPATATDVALPAIRVDDVAAAFTAIVRHFRPSRSASIGGISPQAVVSPSARLGPRVQVHAGATIGDDVELAADCVIHSGVRILAGCRLEEQVTVYPNAVLYEDTLVGPRTIIHAGAILGAFGFGYKTVDGRHQLTSQLGYVVLEADVEVGANSTIDRGTYGPTVIGEGTKLDNQVQVGHNCRIGRHNLLCAQVGIAGSTTTEDYVVLAGQAGIKDHVRIGKGAIVGAMSGITNDVPAGARMLGLPATPEREQKLMLAHQRKLPEIRRQLKSLLAQAEQVAGRESRRPGTAPSADDNSQAA
ncbi:MAG: UDP-3-O-(3-hydroxymyristoyl)glucosamine N-acyltransferase [Pirellulales bacterium]